MQTTKKMDSYTLYLQKTHSRLYAVRILQKRREAEHDTKTDPTGNPKAIQMEPKCLHGHTWSSICYLQIDTDFRSRKNTPVLQWRRAPRPKTHKALGSNIWIDNQIMINMIEIKCALLCDLAAAGAFLFRTCVSCGSYPPHFCWSCSNMFAYG